jgi:hypothetical protein
MNAMSSPVFFALEFSVLKLTAAYALPKLLDAFGAYLIANIEFQNFEDLNAEMMQFLNQDYRGSGISIFNHLKGFRIFHDESQYNFMKINNSLKVESESYARRLQIMHEIVSFIFSLYNLYSTISYVSTLCQVAGISFSPQIFGIIIGCVVVTIGVQYLFKHCKSYEMAADNNVITNLDSATVLNQEVIDAVRAKSKKVFEGRAFDKAFHFSSSVLSQVQFLFINLSTFWIVKSAIMQGALAEILNFDFIAKLTNQIHAVFRSISKFSELFLKEISTNYKSCSYYKKYILTELAKKQNKVTFRESDRIIISSQLLGREIRNVELESGKIYAIKGRNGTGKTETLEALVYHVRSEYSAVIAHPKDMDVQYIRLQRDIVLNEKNFGRNLLEKMENIITSMKATGRAGLLAVDEGSFAALDHKNKIKFFRETSEAIEDSMITIILAIADEKDSPRVDYRSYITVI